MNRDCEKDHSQQGCPEAERFDCPISITEAIRIFVTRREFDAATFDEPPGPPMTAIILGAIALLDLAVSGLSLLG